MSSILEALRELEGTKPSSRRSRVAWAAGAEDERAPLRRAAEVLGIVAFGLALGVAGFGLFVWLGVPGEVEPEAQAPFAAAVPARVDAPTAAPAPQPLAPAAPAPSVPAWLARMGPPRGRVDGGDDDARAEPAAEAAVAPRGAGLSLVRVRYGESRSERTATLRIDGNPLVLHEGESAEGIELQLVTPNGAYVRRGGEVLMLAPSR